MFMKRVKVQIQHGRLVARHERRAGLVLAHVLVLDDGEGAASTL